MTFTLFRQAGIVTCGAAVFFKPSTIKKAPGALRTPRAGKQVFIPIYAYFVTIYRAQTTSVPFLRNLTSEHPFRLKF